MDTPPVFDFMAALRIAENVFAKYRQDHPDWWARMDGTPILNDIAVRMAESFLESEVTRTAESTNGRAILESAARVVEREFKNFHRLLCERFDYSHDEVAWHRDLLSLIEWIAERGGEKKQHTDFSHSLFEAALAIVRARDAFIAQPIPPGIRTPLLYPCTISWDLMDALCVAVKGIEKASVAQLPVAWMKHVVSHNGPSGPDEHDIDFWSGDEPPNETDGWQPLFGMPQSTPKSIDLHWRANIRLVRENQALKSAAAAKTDDLHILRAFQRGDVVFIELDNEISDDERSRLGEVFGRLNSTTGVTAFMLPPGVRLASARRVPPAPPSAVPTCSDDIAGNPVAWFSPATGGVFTAEEKSNYVPASDVAHFNTPLYAKAPRETCMYRRVDELLILTTCGRELSHPRNPGDFCSYCGSFIEYELT
jgi:hypothetical protein